MKKHFNFDNSYNKLREVFYTYTKPTSVKEPRVFLYNKDYAAEIAVLEGASDSEIAEILSGNKVPEDAILISQAYCGHQFGYLNELGDGRAILLGEQITPDNKRLDVQLKGSGKTPYSRSGDGRATLSSMIREYLISEAMHHLNVKTTRSLAVVTTGEKVNRERRHDGAILTRTASSHIRVGTFQFAALQNDEALLKELADYTIGRHYPHLKKEKMPYISLFREIMNRQITLLLDWMRIGFVHGVLNTDNVSIAGETIDYGPCAFMDAYHTNTVFSSIDIYGRYNYGSQPRITGWNMARLAESFIPLIVLENDFDLNSDASDEKALAILNAELQTFLSNYDSSYLNMMAHKIGFDSIVEDDEDLIKVLLNMMELFAFDYTNTFIYLRHLIEPLAINVDKLLPNDKQARELFNTWVREWFERIEKKSLTKEDVLTRMEEANPMVIPRNHLVESAIKSADKGNLGELEELIEVLKNSYDYSLSEMKYLLPSDLNETFVTYCGT